MLGDAGPATGALDANARKAAHTPLDYPTVGDWVVRTLSPQHDRRVAITGVLPRSGLLCRRAAGPRPKPQLVAANADVLAVVTTAEGTLPAPAGLGPTPRTPASDELGHRIEWYLAAAFGGGALPVIVVNKIDVITSAGLEEVIGSLRSRLGAAAGEVPILATSAADGRGTDALAALARDGGTVALSGPSGVGKSSLVNRIAGTEVVPIAPLSSDGRGRHTTVRRQLVPVGGTGGGTVIDTPGLQDLVPWGGDLGLEGQVAGIGLSRVFPEIAELASRCHFTDCAHAVEPHCAVIEAVAHDRMPAARLDAYRSLAADLQIE